MRMEVDALDYATEGVLSMECGDGKWRPVIFLSKSLNKTERNYEIHDKEMLAIIRELENWRHFVVATTCYLMTNDLTMSKALNWAIK